MNAEVFCGTLAFRAYSGPTERAVLARSVHLCPGLALLTFSSGNLDVIDHVQQTPGVQVVAVWLRAGG